MARLWWSIGLIVALGTGAASGVLLGFEAAPKEQAKKIEKLLQDSTEALASLRTALASTNPCQQQAAFQDVLSRRKSELKAAGKLKVDRLPSYKSLKSNLVTALQYSVAADQAYADWADGSSCSSRAAKHYLDGNTASAQASAAKGSFMKVWKASVDKYKLTAAYDF